MSTGDALPSVPETKPEDAEDVSWALSTAEAMWARGDHVDAIKWIRKAAEAASDVEDDMRALELAKAASDLAAAVAVSSQAAPSTIAPQEDKVVASHGPPSAPPPGRVVGKAMQGPRGARQPAPPASGPPKIAAKPPAVPASPPPPLPVAEGDGGRARKRRSRDNFEHEAKTVTVAAVAADGEARGESKAPVSERGRGRRRGSTRPPEDSTVVTSLEALEAQKRRSAVEWDASPTMNVVGGDLSREDLATGDRATAFAPPAPTNAPPEEVVRAPRASVRPPAATLHDPAIQTSQAVRVIVWRDANGVHVAPSGTRVTAITVEAVLVALEPNADLTAWLSQR